MSFSLQGSRVHPKTAGKEPAYNSSTNLNLYLVRWLAIIVEEAKTLLNRFSRSPRTSGSTRTITTINTLDEMSGPFIAKESFKRGADVVFFGDELYGWRPEFNIRPAFIALRPIESGEEVFSNPTDLDVSDLMPHWALIHNPKLH